MKREQNACHDENVILLLNRRTEAQIVIEQVNADLTHVGYNWPQSAPQPKRLTEHEWHALLDINGNTIVHKGVIHSMEQDNIHLRNQVMLQMAKVARLQKQLKKKPAKKVAKKK